jgi:hypothetical protein
MGFCRLLVSGWEAIWPDPKGFGVNAHVAQLAERVLGKDEVISSTLIMGSIDDIDAWDHGKRYVRARVTLVNRVKQKNRDNNTSGDSNGKRAISTNETARQRRHYWTY